jgi:hypothetical protein
MLFGAGVGDERSSAIPMERVDMVLESGYIRAATSFKFWLGCHANDGSLALAFSITSWAEFSPLDDLFEHCRYPPISEYYNT